MAAKRGRNIMLWFVLAIFTSPFLAILMIACIGETDENVRRESFKRKSGETCIAEKAIKMNTKILIE